MSANPGFAILPNPKPSRKMAPLHWCRLYAATSIALAALSVTLGVLLWRLSNQLKLQREAVRVKTRYTKKFPLYTDDRQFLTAQQALVDRVNNETTLWKAKLNAYASPPPPSLYRDVNQSDLVRSIERDYLSPRFLNATIQRQATILNLNWTAVQLPEEFDARQKWGHVCPTLHDIWDQAGCGSCWANGSTEQDKTIFHPATLKPPVASITYEQDVEVERQHR